MRNLPVLWLLLALSACHQAPPPPLPFSPQLNEPELKVFGDRLVFAGAITRNSYKLFAKYIESGQISTLVIASGGGDVDAAIDIAEIVFERGLNVEVQVACISSCANYIFPAGRVKTISPGAVVGWHGNVTHLTYLNQLDPRRADEAAKQSNLRTAEREAKFFRAIGVDGFICWFAKLPPYNVKGTYSMSKEDMENFGLRNIQAPLNYTSTDLSPLHATGPERIEFITVSQVRLKTLRPVGFE